MSNFKEGDIVWLAPLPDAEVPVPAQRGTIVGSRVNGTYMVELFPMYRDDGPNDDGLVEVPEEQLRLIARGL